MFLSSSTQFKLMSAQTSAMDRAQHTGHMETIAPGSFNTTFYEQCIRACVYVFLSLFAADSLLHRHTGCGGHMKIIILYLDSQTRPSANSVSWQVCIRVHFFIGS